VAVSRYHQLPAGPSRERRGPPPQSRAGQRRGQFQPIEIISIKSLFVALDSGLQVVQGICHRSVIFESLCIGRQTHRWDPSGPAPIGQIESCKAIPLTRTTSHRLGTIDGGAGVGPEPASLSPVLQGPALAAPMLRTITAQPATMICFVIIVPLLGFRSSTISVFGAPVYLREQRCDARVHGPRNLPLHRFAWHPDEERTGVRQLIRRRQTVAFPRDRMLWPVSIDQARVLSRLRYAAMSV